MALPDVSLTSDKDYLKIHMDGSLTISANGALDADSTFPATPFFPALVGSQTITHGLGYVPLVRVFWDANKNGVWYNSYWDNVFVKIDPYVTFVNTTNDFKIIMNTDGAAKTDIPVYYRIYDLQNLATNSDSRIDKIFLKGSSNALLNAAAGVVPEQSTLTIPHGAGEVPLFTLQFSEDQTNWYEAGTQKVGGPDLTSGPPGGPYARYYFTSAFASIDNTNIYIVVQSFYDVQKTVYVRYTLDYKS